MEPRKITEETLAAFARQLGEEERSPATLEKYLREVRQFAAFLGGREVTGNSWQTWCCRYWPMWHRKSGKTYVRDRRRASPWRKPAGSAGGEKRKTYLLISRHSTRPGKMGR